MRTEQEMLALILDTAKADERIRAVIMNGSRTNPNAPRDLFQDYDIVYVVAEMAPFVRNLAWIERFGPMMILQLPDDMGEPPPVPSVSYGYLMQFADGNRIDLTIYPLDRLTTMERDSLSILLLDKDGVVEPYPPPSERDYLPAPPSAKDYDDCCNEFWWVSTYVAKGLWRNDIIYAKHHLDAYVRAQLMKMLTWYFGVRTGFAQSPGKMGRNFPRFLEPQLWQMLLETYADADVDHTWDALLTMCELFRRVAIPVAEQFGYTYPHGDDQRVSAHLEHVRVLPRPADAQQHTYFELRRLSDDLIYQFDRQRRPDGQVGYKRRDADLWIVFQPDLGWVAVDEATQEITGRSWDVLPDDRGDHPPEGEWVSKKGPKSYVYELKYLAPPPMAHQDDVPT